MQKVFALKNRIQPYSWGSRDAIPSLLGIGEPGGGPMAELWMGAHPKAPSTVLTDGGERGLDRFIADHPQFCLGDRVLDRFGRLPFLFKVLAAAEPLSLQAHPDLETARNGYAREQAAGIPLDSPERNYRDDNHKPEIICALTPFAALRGFRPIPGLIDAFRTLTLPGLEDDLSDLERHPGREGLSRFFSSLIGSRAGRKDRLLGALADRVRKRDDDRSGWIRKLLNAYPGDMGAFAPLYLNLVRLSPGEAMFLPAGELHAYLEGTGMELMAGSDNVLRGGLTHKHVDIPELLRVLTFEDGIPQILKPRAVTRGGSEGLGGSDEPDGVMKEEIYPAPVDEFRLARIEMQGGAVSRPVSDPRILILLEGKVALRVPDDGTIELERGDSAFVAAEAGTIRFEGKGTLYQASVANEYMD